MDQKAIKWTYYFLVFLEILLVLAAMIGIKGAQRAAEQKGTLMFFIYATYAALVPITLAAFSRAIRLFLKKEMVE